MLLSHSQLARNIRFPLFLNCIPQLTYLNFELSLSSTFSTKMTCAVLYQSTKRIRIKDRTNKKIKSIPLEYFQNSDTRDYKKNLTFSLVIFIEKFLP